jgi:hypothetical protein
VAVNVFCLRLADNLESLPGSPIYDEDNREWGRGRIRGRGLMLLPRTARRRQKYCTIFTIMLVTLHANENDVPDGCGLYTI